MYLNYVKQAFSSFDATKLVKISYDKKGWKMAEPRMFSKSIIDSDLFLDIPTSTQNFHFHLCMRANDDGFVHAPLRIMRMICASKDDLNLLIAKMFVIPFESGVCVIRHWKVHNYMRTDRYKPVLYQNEKALLLEDNDIYRIMTKHDNRVSTNDIPTVDVGEVSLEMGKISIRGIGGNLGERDSDTFANGLHRMLRADFVLANPLFNVSDYALNKDDVC